MESLVVTINGQGDNISKVIASDAPEEVDLIIQDIDNIVNGETPAEATAKESTAPQNLSNQNSKTGAFTPPKVSVSKSITLQNEDKQGQTVDVANFEGTSCGKEYKQNQQTPSCPKNSEATWDTEQKQKLSIDHLKTCQISAVIASSLSTSSSSSPCVVNKNSVQTAQTLPPFLTANSTQLHISAKSPQPLDATSVVNTSLSSPHVQSTKPSSFESSNTSSISKHPSSEKTQKSSTNSVLEVSHISTFDGAEVEAQDSSLLIETKSADSSTTETSSSHLPKSTNSITNKSSDPSVQCCPNSLLDSHSNTAQQDTCLSATKTSSVSDVSCKEPQTSSIKEIKSLNKAVIEDSKHEMTKPAANTNSKDLIDALDCEINVIKKQSEIDLKNERASALNMGVAANTQEKSNEYTESDNISQGKCVNDAEPCEIDLVGEFRNMSNIQILESTSISNSHLSIEKEKTEGYEVENNKEGIDKRNALGSNMSVTETDDKIKNDSHHKSLNSEQKDSERESFKQNKHLVNNLLDYEHVTKADKTNCIIPGKDKVSTSIILDDKNFHMDNNVNNNYTDAIILIDEDSECKLEDSGMKKSALKSIIEAACTTNKAADSENYTGKDLMVYKNETAKKSFTESKNKHPDPCKADAEKVELPSNKVVLKNDRKRHISSEDESFSKPKCSKLDEVVKPNVSDCHAMEVVDSDDDVILAEENDSSFNKTFKSNKLGNSLEKKDMKLEEFKKVDPKDETVDTKALDLLPISLSSQVLQAFITARFKAFIKKQKLQQTNKLNKRITSMQSSTTLWKETAKHLERSVKEITVITKGVEKRRAHVNDCKKVSSRTVGTQVNDDKVKFALSAAQNSNCKPETAATNSSLGPSVLLNPSTPQQPSQNPQWRYHQVSSQPARAQVPQAQTGTPSAPSRYVRPPTQAPVRPPPPAYSDVVNLIDLTDDDDVSKNASQSHGVAQPRKTVPNNRSRGSTPMTGGKAVTGNVNGFIPLGPNHTVMGNTTVTSALQHHSVAGPKGQTLTSSASTGQSNKRQNSNLSQASNQMTGNVPDQPENVMPGSRAPPPPYGAGAPSISGKQMQESHGSKSITMHTLPPSFFIQQQRHPAPLPSATESNPPNVRALKLPPKPTLKISRVSQGIVLSWNMPPLVGIEVITSYQLFAYQETDSAPKTSLWKKVGDVRALPLPMACTLTQFQEGNKYHFAVRAVDKFNRAGDFSDPSSIFLGIGSTNTKIALRG